jgi:hypothetical protein
MGSSALNKMQKVNSMDFNSEKIKQFSISRIQDGFISFLEQPSDKYDEPKKEVTTCTTVTPCTTDNRINAFELFSLFTAEIIKEKLPFIK